MGLPEWSWNTNQIRSLLYSKPTDGSHLTQSSNPSPFRGQVLTPSQLLILHSSPYSLSSSLIEPLAIPQTCQAWSDLKAHEVWAVYCIYLNVMCSPPLNSGNQTILLNSDSRPHLLVSSWKFSCIVFHSVVSQLFVRYPMVSHLAPLSMDFSRQEY